MVKKEEFISLVNYMEELIRNWLENYLLKIEEGRDWEEKFEFLV